MKWHNSTFDIFFGLEHRMRKEEMEEQFNKEAKQGWRFAADVARITDENASSGATQARVGRSFCGSRWQIWSSFRKRRRAVTSIPGTK